MATLIVQAVSFDKDESVVPMTPRERGNQNPKDRWQWAFTKILQVGTNAAPSMFTLIVSFYRVTKFQLEPQFIFLLVLYCMSRKFCPFFAYRVPIRRKLRQTSWTYCIHLVDLLLVNSCYYENNLPYVAEFLLM